MTKEEFEVWANRTLAVCQLESQEEIDEFCNLLSTAKNQIDADVLRVLLRTFSDADDYGIQEQTRNIVQSADKNMYYPVIRQAILGSTYSYQHFEQCFVFALVCHNHQHQRMF